MEEENIESDVENICDLSLNLVDVEIFIKMYEFFIKRMLKIGEFFDVKRFFVEEDFVNGNDSIVIVNKESVKRNLSIFKVNEKRKKIKFKVLVVNNYQLTMSVYRKNNMENVSIVNDDVLGELLGELDFKLNLDLFIIID